MKRFLLATAMTTLLSSAAMAEPGGCFKYGAAGAVAGHFVGEGNKMLGALAGCAAGMLRRRQHRNAEQEAENERLRYHTQREMERRDQAARQPPPSYRPPPSYQGSSGGGQPSPWTNPGAYAPR